MAKNISINFSFSKAAKRSGKIIRNGIDDIARIQVSAIKTGFISGVDVKDKKYKPSIVNRRPIRLFKSGTMRDGVHVSTFTKPTSPIKATITSGVRSKNYAEVHNEGIGVMPKRQFFPTDKLLKRTQSEVNQVIRGVERKLVIAVK